MPSIFRSVRWLPVIAAAALPLSTLAADTTVVLQPSQDTSIFFGTPGSENLADGSGDFLWTSVTAEGLVRRALVKFTLETIPPGSQIKQVTLSLYESRSRDTHVVAVHRLLATWGEGASNAGGAGTGAAAAPGDATWVNRFHPGSPWARSGGDFDPLPSAQQVVGFPNQAYTWSASLPTAGAPVPRLLQDVQAWVDAPANNHGWMLIGDETNQQNAKRFESRNNAVAVNRPRLTVVYGPPPVASSDDGDVPLPLWALAMLAGAFGTLMVRSAHR